MSYIRGAAIALATCAMAIATGTIILPVEANPVWSAPTAALPTVTKTSSTNIAQEMVKAHNQWRAKVGVPPLRWSNSLATYAQEWANQLMARRAFEHRRNSNYGENLFMGSGKRWSPTEVVNSWGNEVKDYNYRNNSCRGVCGHYTQIVWKKTTEVGCAVARSGNREIWVCNYNPPGNYIGQKPY